MSATSPHYNNTRRKSRSSLVYCTERFSCNGDKAPAAFECSECETLQCVDCESNLHQHERYQDHFRTTLSPAAASLLCEQASCERKNFTDVVCQNCNSKRLCFECDHKTHLNKKSHVRRAFTGDQKQDKEFLKDCDSGPTELNISDDRRDTPRSHPPVARVAATISKANPELGYGNSPARRDSEPPSLDLYECAIDSEQHLLVSGASSDESGSFKSFQRQSFQESMDRDKQGDQQLRRATKHTATAAVEPVQTSKSPGWPKAEEYDQSSALMKSSPFQQSDSLPLGSGSSEYGEDLSPDRSATATESFELANQHEQLLVSSEEEFLNRLGCDPDSTVKVISIFGNTGDGKSYTLNHTFLGGREVFKTSSQQTSCTVGVWAAYDPMRSAILLDTEGLLGISTNQNQRTRLLLKVLAVSDIVIYRTRAERLHSDMFHFLSDASTAYLKHFKVELTRVSEKLRNDSSPADGSKQDFLSTLCPAVIIFHETQHTDIVTKGASEPAEKFIRDQFHTMGLSCEAFSVLQYVGTRTNKPPTDFKNLLLATKKQLRDTAVRCARHPSVVYRTLKILNEKFSGNIESDIPNLFPDQYFTCRTECLACKTRCCQTMNHEQEGTPHEADRKCQCILQAQYSNTVYTCQACFKRGLTVEVVPKTSASTESSWLGLASFVWSGYVLECMNCGIIYRSRQHWYGNSDPEKSVVRIEIRHVWPGTSTVLMGTHNAARRVFDGLNYVTDTIAGVSSKPSKAVASWVMDQIAPPYWRPNAEITECKKCREKFSHDGDIHHCRRCGEGFCDACSTKRRPVPERDWGLEPVRVCDGCFEDKNPVGPEREDAVSPAAAGARSDTNQLMPRRVGEVIGSTVGTLASVVNYPYAALRDAARPAYWIADEEITKCVVCEREFGVKLRLHHCRACGHGVCADCSPSYLPVPSRGWDHPVRVCNSCGAKPEKLQTTAQKTKPKK